ncbi:helix-turn-helix domain-containing protein [Halorussus ruber]|uniref:helix-turn-helix domain-containing protein n=1 Tax=Halorussus ruber TaxID=1126238 RepID=UPI0010928C75|nr:helix-turn-helix domain-containing protein [Halorussus ruber]
MIVELERREEWNGLIRKIISEETTVYFSGFDDDEAEKRAIVFKEIWERSGGCEIIESESIPVDVVTMGRAAVVAYRYSIHQRSVKEIAEEFKVAESTVEQYLSDFQQGRR